MNYDNSKLFSIGLDGVLACFSMKDNDPISKNNAQTYQSQIEFSEEILIEKNKLDQTNQRIADLKYEIDQHEKNKQIALELKKEANLTTIRELNEQISALKSEFAERNAQLTQEKAFIEAEAEKDQAYLKRLHEEEMRTKKQEFQEKLLSDTNRYDQLMEQKENQKRTFESQLGELHLNQ